MYKIYVLSSKESQLPYEVEGVKNDLSKEIGNRQLVLQHMLNHKVRSVEGVQVLLELYYKDPQKVLNQILLNR